MNIPIYITIMTKKIEHKVENGVETKYCGKCKVY